MKTSLKNRLCILLNVFRTFSRLSQFALLLKRREFWLELKRRDRARVQTEMVEFNASPFPFSIKLKIWSFHVVSCAGTAKKCTKKGQWCTCRVVVFPIKPIRLFWRSPCRRRRSFVIPNGGGREELFLVAVLAVSSAETTLISLTVFYRPPLTCKPSQLFSTLENTVIIFLFLKKFCITIFFSFSQAKLKTMVIQDCWGDKKIIMVFSKEVNRDSSLCK